MDETRRPATISHSISHFRYRLSRATDQNQAAERGAGRWSGFTTSSAAQNTATKENSHQMDLAVSSIRKGRQIGGPSGTGDYQSCHGTEHCVGEEAGCAQAGCRGSKQYTLNGWAAEVLVRTCKSIYSQRRCIHYQSHQCQPRGQFWLSNPDAEVPIRGLLVEQGNKQSMIRTDSNDNVE